ncbi:MAG: metallophosphoesterase [Desulfobacterota bacterium]|nr:metallophosphoesterase [Thermodesulfobacteriota bacterium]
MILEDLCDQVRRVVEGEPRLIQLPSEGKVVFVGDTHGDLEASERVIDRYLREPYRIVFLGDYVDRGDDSEGNIQFLFRMKRDHPEEIFLLAGNHEGFMTKPLYPADFWESLPARKRRLYDQVFSALPLCATSSNGVIALHGALPDLRVLEELNRIEWGDSNWDRIVWGDFVEAGGDFLGQPWGRPQFGGDYFCRLMERYQKRLLIRSHQPNAPTLMFQDRCITIFTSRAYPLARTIVVADMEKEIRGAGDVRIERI